MSVLLIQKMPKVVALMLDTHILGNSLFTSHCKEKGLQCGVVESLCISS